MLLPFGRGDQEKQVIYKAKNLHHPLRTHIWMEGMMNTVSNKAKNPTKEGIYSLLLCLLITNSEQTSLAK